MNLLLWLYIAMVFPFPKLATSTVRQSRKGNGRNPGLCGWRRWVRGRFGFTRPRSITLTLSQRRAPFHGLFDGDDAGPRFPAWKATCNVEIMTKIDQIDISAYVIPTKGQESDGTLQWNSTTIAVVEARAGDETGLGFTYGDLSVARLIDRTLSPLVLGKDAFQIPEIWTFMMREVRNIMRPGIASMAIAAVDGALWDLKARLLRVPLVTLLGAEREGVPLYASGGFTSSSIGELEEQLHGWSRGGFHMVKMKVGRNPGADAGRVAAARQAIGWNCELFVDANGAYTHKQGLEMAEHFAESGVRWFEEPVSSDDLDGLRLIRDRAPAGMDIAAGEYGYDAYYFQRMLQARAVDVLQIDATRCGGITGFLKAAHLADAHQIPISAHAAPSFHLHVCCAAPRLVHLEYFLDHVRIEDMLFDGVIEPSNGLLRPDLSRYGNGLELKEQDARRFAA
jgi:L-alanine-DL-glutamate epimerase-like enolase superfamily enzyme